jgi:hypothetical protein
VGSFCITGKCRCTTPGLISKCTPKGRAWRLIHFESFEAATSTTNWMNPKCTKCELNTYRALTCTIQLRIRAASSYLVTRTSGGELMVVKESGCCGLYHHGSKCIFDDLRHVQVLHNVSAPSWHLFLTLFDSILYRIDHRVHKTFGSFSPICTPDHYRFNCTAN